MSIGHLHIELPRALRQVLTDTPELAEAYLVGGSVRDTLLGQSVKDFDLEVFGIGLDSLSRALSRYGKVDQVGKSFGVIKLWMEGAEYDFSLPRRESKIGTGHKGFAVVADAALLPEEASSRRDYTINSLMWHPRTGQLLDFHGGVRDLEQRILRHTSEAFSDDPLRVLRGMQFAARFHLTPDSQTLQLCQSITGSFAELPAERIWGEWWNWATKSIRPSRGLAFLRETHWLQHFPELFAILETPQDPDWHPEGSVFLHTGHCCDAMVLDPQWQSLSEQDRGVYLLAILLHDVGKAGTTQREMRKGVERIVSPGHEEFGVPLAEAFLQRMRAPGWVVERVLPLVRNHMAHFQSASDRAVRRLAKRLEPESIRGLGLIMKADCCGRPPKSGELPQGAVDLLRRAEELEVAVEAPEPILRGSALVARGLLPGPALGELLRKAYDAQLEGSFSDEPGALAWAELQGAFAPSSPKNQP